MHIVTSGPAREDFLAALRQNGFYRAANSWRDDWIDFDVAAAAWDAYPQCMARYPTELTNDVYANSLDGRDDPHPQRRWS